MLKTKLGGVHSWPCSAVSVEPSWSMEPRSATHLVAKAIHRQLSITKSMNGYLKHEEQGKGNAWSSNGSMIRSGLSPCLPTPKLALTSSPSNREEWPASGCLPLPHRRVNKAGPSEAFCRTRSPKLDYF